MYILLLPNWYYSLTSPHPKDNDTRQSTMLTMHIPYAASIHLLFLTLARPIKLLYIQQQSQ